MENRFGIVDHRPFGGLGLELIYGQRPDGAIVNIAEVTSGLACDCVCPACRRRLVARKGRKMAHHFAHSGDGGACAAAGETNAHIWAKRVLERTRRILLPAIETEMEGRKHTKRQASIFEFDDVRLEQRLGAIVPDVILRARDRELIVEVWVTHRCDEEKITKIQEGGVSAIEVDLSHFRTCEDEAAVEQALLRDSPRSWLFNPFIETAKQELREKLDKEKVAQAEARRRQARQIAAGIRNAKPELSERLKQERERLAELGRRAHFEHPTISSDGFVVPPTMWQAAIFSRVFLPQAGKPRWNRVGVGSADLLDNIADCLAPPLRRPLGGRLAEAVRREAPDLVLPGLAVEDYLHRLTDAGVLHNDGEAFSLTDRESEALASSLRGRDLAKERLANTRRRILVMVDALPEPERQGFELEGWLSRPQAILRTSVARLATADTTSWWRLEERLSEIEWMLAGGPTATELLGLPLKAATARARERLRLKEEEARRKEEERVREAAAGRVASIVARAQTVLNTEADEWLSRPGRQSGLTPMQAAEKDDEGLQRAFRALWKIEDDRERQAALDRIAAEARAELQRVAQGRFPEGHAQVFLNSAHPDLGGQRPLAYCQDPVSLRMCLALLPQNGGRRSR